MTGRLPFTLAPLDGEPFGLWLHAYAARLAMRPGHLAEALGMPARQDHGTGTAVPDGSSAAQLAAICASAGLAPSAVTTMLAAGPSPPTALMLAWAPQRTSRFCPACLAEDPAQIPAAWWLPVTFFCLRHGRLLASRCPRCGHPPASRPLPSRAGHCCGPHGCGGRLDAASPPPHDGTPAARQAQEAISGLLAGLRDPAGTAASRRQALSRLTDITLTAYHLAAESDQQCLPGRAFTPGMLDAGVLTTAFTLLTARPDPSGQDPLASLVTGIPPGAVPPAIPSSWRPASPALAARIARARDPWLRPADRLRHATTLPVPRAPAPRPPCASDLAAARAARLPGQLWPDWAVRLTDDPASSSHDKFLPAALIALLLPHSDMPLNQVTAIVSGQLRRHIAGYHMSKLTPGALRILTELALAIDERGIPIDYRRRRDLAASTTLINGDAWAKMTREAGMRLAPVASARRYLYELLTGCALVTAPPPYRLRAGSLGSYNDFIVGMPASLAASLAGHARRLLDEWRIDHEPLQWQPPDDWVTVTRWPGADPARTDPAPIHHALLNEDIPPAQIASNLGISAGHLRQVLRRHPLPRPRRPVRHTLIPAPEPATRPPGQQPGVIYLDPGWLRTEYLTWHRSLDDIAAQAGCPLQTLNQFARDHGIPVRNRGTSSYIPAASAPGIHPRDLPEPLRSALIGPRARSRLDRLLFIAGHSSILAAAQALGLWQSALYDQVARLERACGGPLANRGRRPAGTVILTPLGQQLCQQARDYLACQPGPSVTSDRPTPGSTATADSGASGHREAVRQPSAASCHNAPAAAR
jgi:TniQ/Bacterial regulatory helix-turn-helix protein, lysR family